MHFICWLAGLSSLDNGCMACRVTGWRWVVEVWFDYFSLTLCFLVHPIKFLNIWTKKQDTWTFNKWDSFWLVKCTGPYLIYQHWPFKFLVMYIPWTLITCQCECMDCMCMLHITSHHITSRHIRSDQMSRGWWVRRLRFFLGPFIYFSLILLIWGFLAGARGAAEAPLPWHR